MVLPLLPFLGLLAGTAAVGQAGITGANRFLQNRDRERYKGEMQGLLGDLPEDAGPDQTARALAMGGMLSPEAMMQYGFGDHDRADKFGYDWQLAQLDNQSQLAQLGARAQQNYFEGRQKIVEAYQPQVDQLNRQFEGLNNVMAIAKEAKAMSPLDYNKWVGSPEGRAVMAQLQELETAGFYDFKRQVYGDAEPPAEVLRDLQEKYQQFTGGGVLTLATDGRWDLIDEIYQRRVQDVQRRAKGVERDYQRSLDSYDANDVMLPGALFGGNIDVGGSPNGGSGGVSMSSRSAPSDMRLINQESGGNWGATNDEGMVGRAQFSPERLDEVREGLNVNFSRDEFLRNPALQKAAEAWHFNDIEDYIQDNGLDKYIGGRVGRIPITLQGMLNVAHLGGKHGLSRFLASGGKYDPADSNGMHLSDYLALGARG